MVKVMVSPNLHNIKINYTYTDIQLESIIHRLRRNTETEKQKKRELIKVHKCLCVVYRSTLKHNMGVFHWFPTI